jgi:hypothetical protein
MTKKNFVFAVVIAFLAQAADVATTIYGVAHGAQESNQLMAGVLSSWGYYGFIVVKLSAVLYFTALTFWSKTFATLCALPFFYFAWHNLTVINSL